MHQPDRDAFLAALLSGESSVDDPQVRARLAADPELTTMYENLQSLTAAVARAGREQAEILATPPEPVARDLADRVAAAVQQAVVERLRRRRRRWLAAAALLLAVLGVGWFLVPPAGAPIAPGDIFLGDDEGLQPSGVVDDYREFRWQEPRPPGGRFEVWIYRSVDGQRGALLHRQSERTLESPWHPPTELQAALPDEIYWELHVFGDESPVLHAHARRRPR